MIKEKERIIHHITGAAALLKTMST